MGTIHKLVLLAALMILVAGCTPATPGATEVSGAAPTQTAEESTPGPSDTPEPTVPAGPVRLEYIGHSCFLVTAPDGTRLVTDPYSTAQAPSGLTRFFPDDVEAEGVTISHFHGDHSNLEGVQGDPQVFYRPGSYQVGMITILGYEGDHGLLDGVPAGANTVFVFGIGQVKIVHLGAAGVVTQADILEAIQDADIITIDLQGDPTHPLVEQMAQMEEVNARTIVATHYSIDPDVRFFGAPTVDEFVETLASGVVVVREGSVVEVTPGMPAQVMIMTPSALVE